jgi:hypothetical protein
MAPKPLYECIEYRAGSGSPRCSRPLSPAALRQEVDIRYVLTSLAGNPQHLYEVYCQSGQMENLIKLHKAQLASDRISYHSATANQTVCLHGLEANHPQGETRVARMGRAVPQTRRVSRGTSYRSFDKWVHVHRRALQLKH